MSLACQAIAHPEYNGHLAGSVMDNGPRRILCEPPSVIMILQSCGFIRAYQPLTPLAASFGEVGGDGRRAVASRSPNAAPDPAGPRLRSGSQHGRLCSWPPSGCCCSCHQLKSWGNEGTEERGCALRTPVSPHHKACSRVVTQQEWPLQEGVACTQHPPRGVPTSLRSTRTFPERHIVR